MKHLNLISCSPEDTQAIGRHLGELAQPGDVFLLMGDLGAGKTCLTQGIARGLDIEDYVLSPSFVIMRELYGRLPLYHLDLYRLEQLAEISDLGLDDYLYGDGLCVVEWAERGLKLLPPENLEIKITLLSDTQRGFRFQPCGNRYRELVTKLKPRLKALERDD